MTVIKTIFFLHKTNMQSIMSFSDGPAPKRMKIYSSFFLLAEHVISPMVLSPYSQWTEINTF